MYDLPEYVRRGLEQARKRDFGRKYRLRVCVGDDSFPIVRLWDTGFSMDANAAPFLRGYVDIYDGARQIYQCLVVCSSVDGGERVYEFKRHTLAIDEAPVDFFRAQNAPIALLD